MVRFGRSLLFCHLELDKEAISDDCRSENPDIGVEILNLSDFRELSVCSACGPFLKIDFTDLNFETFHRLVFFKM